jgi:uncharacterized protein YukE
MIADPVGAAGIGAFPDPPKGDPGGIESAARQLEQVGQALQDVEAGLRASAHGLGQDWDGDAAGAYRLASEGLGTTARAAAATFGDCAQAVRGYGNALQDCQRQLEHLRKAFTDALARESTAAGKVEGLIVAAQAPHAPPSVSTDLTNAQTAQSDAVGDAQRILRRAHDVLNAFHDHEKATIGTLSGQHTSGPGGLGGAFASPFGQAPGVGTGIGPGFGIPQGGLAAFDGTIHAGDPWHSDIPGLGTYWDGTHPSAVPTDDLTNVVLFAAGGVGSIGLDTLRAAAGELASATARQLGLVGERKVAGAAFDDAFDEALGLGRNGAQRAESMRARLSGARDAGTRASAQASTDLRAARADTLEKAIDVAKKLGVKVPDGVQELAPHLYRYSDQYRYYAMYKLLQLREALATRGPAGAAAARAIDQLLGSGR